MKSIEKFVNQLYINNLSFTHTLPSLDKAGMFADGMFKLLFPLGSNSDIPMEQQIEVDARRMQFLLKELLLPLHGQIKTEIDQIVDGFFEQLPDVFQELLKDAQVILQYDPAAYSVEEVVAAYPGFYAICIYRMSHILYQMEVPVLPRMISEHAHSRTAIDINPGATIGPQFFIDHGTGVVIGETCIIGKNVKLYQGVTLGALNVSKELAQKKRHPTIEDNVIVYSGTTILGGNTIVGHDSIVGGNVWLTRSVDPYSLIYNRSETKIRSLEIDEEISFVI